MLLTSLLAAIESAFNQWLSLDEATLPRLTPMQGKIIQLHITGLDIQLFFIPTATRIQLYHDYDATPDVTIRGNAIALTHLSTGQDTTKALLTKGISIEGDLALGEQFGRLLREIDIDWEEQLSYAVGDIVAHHMGQLGRETSGWLSDTTHAMRLNTTEYLQEELRLTPNAMEVNDYLDAVDQLRADADRLDTRLQRLQNKGKP